MIFLSHQINTVFLAFILQTTHKLYINHHLFHLQDINIHSLYIQYVWCDHVEVIGNPPSCQWYETHTTTVKGNAVTSLLHSCQCVNRILLLSFLKNIVVEDSRKSGPFDGRYQGVIVQAEACTLLLLL